VSTTPSIRWMKVDEGRIRQGHRSGLLLSLSFGALAMMVRWQDGYLAHKIPVPIITRGSRPE